MDTPVGLLSYIRKYTPGVWSSRPTLLLESTQDVHEAVGLPSYILESTHNVHEAVGLPSYTLESTQHVYVYVYMYA